MDQKIVQQLADIAVEFSTQTTQHLSARCPGAEIDEDRLIEGGLHVVTAWIPNKTVTSVSAAVALTSELHSSLHRRTGTQCSDEFRDQWFKLAEGGLQSDGIDTFCPVIMGTLDFCQEFTAVLNASVAVAKARTTALFAL